MEGHHYHSLEKQKGVVGCYEADTATKAPGRMGFVCALSSSLVTMGMLHTTSCRDRVEMIRSTPWRLLII